MAKKYRINPKTGEKIEIVRSEKVKTSLEELEELGIIKFNHTKFFSAREEDDIKKEDDNDNTEN